MTETFTRRSIKWQTVAKRDLLASGGAAITGSDGWTAIGPAAVAEVLTEGTAYGLESYGFNTIGGFLVGTEAEHRWLYRRSDEEILGQQEEFRRHADERRREMLAKYQDDWAAREAVLPDWLRARLAHFHTRGGESFRLNGWGYELAICELVLLYLDADLAESPAISAFATEHGTSGNQHSMALSIARAHRQAPKRTMAGTVSALSPLTGDSDYSGS